MTAKRRIRHQHYRLRLSDPKATPTYVAGLLRGTRNEIIPHKTTMKAKAWLTCNHPMALALKGQLLVLCGVEATIEICHYYGKTCKPLPGVPEPLSQEVIDSMNFSARNGYTSAGTSAQSAINLTIKQGLLYQQKSSFVQLQMQQLQLKSRRSGKSTMVKMIVDELINPPPGATP